MLLFNYSFTFSLGFNYISLSDFSASSSVSKIPSSTLWLISCHSTAHKWALQPAPWFARTLNRLPLLAQSFSPPLPPSPAVPVSLKVQHYLILHFTFNSRRSKPNKTQLWQTDKGDKKRVPATPGWVCARCVRVCVSVCLCVSWQKDFVFENRKVKLKWLATVATRNQTDRTGHGLAWPSRAGRLG